MPRRKDCIINDSITDALFILLDKKHINDISITELIQKAGVSRNSFYRNFETLEDIAYKYFMQGSYAWWENIVEKEHIQDITVIGKTLFEHFYMIRERIVLAYERGLSSAFIKHIFDCAFRERNANDKQQCYSVARVTGLICGLMNEWVKGKMTDSPEYVAAFLNPQNAYKPVNSSI